MTSPIRAALTEGSSLGAKVQDGLGALKVHDKRLVDEAVRGVITDSLNIDEAFLDGNERENRWDYLLGHGPTPCVVAFEPHTASTGEVATVIAKREAARKHLRAHLRQGCTISAWFWVAAGRTDFVPHDKVIARLAQAGITFVGGRLTSKHLPKAPKPPRGK